MQALLPLVVVNLSSRSQAKRKATLGLLSHFQQPSAQALSSTEEGEPSPILSLLLSVEIQHSFLSSSKSAPAAIEKIQTAFEYRRVPDLLIEATVRSLLGFLNIRSVSIYCKLSAGCCTC